MARLTLAEHGNMSPECGPGTWAVANIAKWVMEAAQEVWDVPGTLSDPSRYPAVEIPTSTPEAPYTPIPEATARFLAERCDPNFGKYDRGLRVMFMDGRGLAKCDRNDKVMESILHIANGDKQPVDLLMRIKARNTPLMPAARIDQVKAQVALPDQYTTPEALEKIIKANRLQDYVGAKMTHSERTNVVRGVLLERHRDPRKLDVATPAEVAEMVETPAAKASAAEVAPLPPPPPAVPAHKSSRAA